MITLLISWDIVVLRVKWYGWVVDEDMILFESSFL